MRSVLLLLALVADCSGLATPFVRPPVRLPASSVAPRLARLSGLHRASTLPRIKAAADAVAEPPDADKGQWKGLAAVLGGVMIHLSCGSMYCWGNLIAYLPSKFRYWAATGAGPPDAALVLPLILVSQMIGMPFGPLLEKQLGPRYTALIGAVMMGLGVFLSSFTSSLLPFTLLYGVLFGVGVGIAYQMPFLTGGRWFPKKKGMVTGAIISGMGTSAFIFNQIQTRLANPTGVNAVAGAFPAAVYARWSPMLRTLGVAYLCLSACGALLQTNPPGYDVCYPLLDRLRGRAADAPADRPAECPADGPTLAERVFSRRFILMWLMIVNSAVSGLAITGSYKTFGMKQAHLNSDGFLTLVGSLSAILGNAAGRFFWGSTSDVYGFRRPFRILASIQLVTMLAFTTLAKTRLTFGLATILMLFCMGGNFAMFPAEAQRAWAPDGASVYSFMFSAFGIAALTGPILGKALLARGGYELLFRVLGCLSLVSLGLSAALPKSQTDFPPPGSEGAEAEDSTAAASKD